MVLWPDNNPLQSAPFQFSSIASEYEDKAVGCTKALAEITGLVEGYGGIHTGPDIDTMVAFGHDIVEGMTSSVSGFEAMGEAFRAASKTIDGLADRETAWRSKVAGLDPDAVSQVESESLFHNSSGFDSAVALPSAPSEVELQAVRDAKAEYDSIRADEDAALRTLAGAIGEAPTGFDVELDQAKVSELLGRLAADVAASDWLLGLTIGQAVLVDHSDGKIDGTDDMFDALAEQGLDPLQIARVTNGEFDEYWTERIVSEGLHPEIVDVAIAHDVPYPDAEWGVLGNTIEELQTIIDDWDTNPIEGVELHELYEERNQMIDRLAKGDSGLAVEVKHALQRGLSIDEAIGVAAEKTFEDSSINETMDAQAAFVDSEGNPYIFAFEIQGHLVDKVETFTGADVEDVDFGVAAAAEEEGISYNHMVVVLQSTDPADLPDGYDVPDFLDVPVRDDAEVAARLAFENYDDGDAFTEIETARQGSVDERDGKMSREDIAAVLDNPDRFSPEAVALATYLDKNPDTRRHLDVASEGRFLDGLDEGEFEPLGDGDGKISRADVTQYQLNVATFEALNNARERGVLGPPERDGQYTTKQLQELRDALPNPSENGPSNRDEYLAVVIDQTIENNWLDSRDKKAKAWDSIQTLNSIGNPVSMVLGRPQHLDDPDFDPSDPLQDYKEFGKGLGDFGVSVYDLAATSPIGAVGTFESARANLFEEMGWEGSTDRGQQTREGLSEMPDAFATLIPGTDAWDEAMEAKRRSGTWNSHQGYAMGKNIVDVETFLNDPARWAGSIAPEVVLSIVTGGTAATVTRGTKLGSKIISATRFTTKHGAKQAARQGLKLTVDTFQTGAQKSRVFITDTGEVITRSGQNLAQTYKETRLGNTGSLDKARDWVRTRILRQKIDTTPEAAPIQPIAPSTIIHPDHPTKRQPERWVGRDDKNNLVEKRWLIEEVEAPKISQDGMPFVHPDRWIEDFNGGGTWFRVDRTTASIVHVLWKPGGAG